VPVVTYITCYRRSLNRCMVRNKPGWAPPKRRAMVVQLRYRVELP